MSDSTSTGDGKALTDPTSLQLNLDDEIATVQTTASATKKREDMRNESTGITVGDSAHMLADVCRNVEAKKTDAKSRN